MAGMQQIGRRSRQSNTYLWSLDNVLRTEKNGRVYKGYMKGEGYELRSVKVLDQTNDAQAKELDILKKLDHENVVKLWAMEKDFESRQTVLVMEYSTGNNLYSILAQSENGYGLMERDFISLLRDLAAGMKHLRDYEISHRNINPTNIVQHQTDDGRNIFKLCDFGTARHLKKDSSFESVYGDIEYQFPEMYENEALDHNSMKQFKASVDLWSIGVTLYQAATGQLPFQPYGGAQQNKKAMFEMTSKKASGFICCSQNRPDGPFNYSDALPETSNLSTGLQKLLIPLLATLLEPNQEKVMTYDEFFKQATAIVLKLVVHVFVASECKLLHVYCDSDICLPEFMLLVRQQMTDTAAAESKILCFEDCLIDGRMNGNQAMSSFAATSPLNPVFVLPDLTVVTDYAKKFEFHTKLPQLAEMAEKVDAMNDLVSAKRVCKEICYLRRTATDLRTKQQLMMQATKKLNFFLQQNLSESFKDFQRNGSTLSAELMNRIQSMMILSEISVIQMFPEKSDSTTEFKGEVERYLQSGLKLSSESNDLHSKMEKLQREVNEDGLCLIFKCRYDIGHNCEMHIESYFKVAKEITDAFEQNVRKIEIGEDDEQRHQCEKQKLRKCFSECLKVVQETRLSSLEKVFKCQMKTYGEYQSKIEVIRSMKHDGNCHLEELKLQIENVDKLGAKMISEVQRTCQKHHGEVTSPSQPLQFSRDRSHHRIIDDKFVFPLQPRVYRELLKAGIVPSQSLGISLTADSAATSEDLQ